MGWRSTELPSPAALKAACQRDLAALVTDLKAAPAGGSVHGARRRIKQLRSQLRLLRRALDDQAFQDNNAALRQAALVLAGHRRAEALVTAAAKLDGAGPSEFWSRLAEAHRIAHAAGGESAAALAEAGRSLERASILLAQTSLSSLANTGLIAQAVCATYARARRRLQRALKSGGSDALHEARKDVIHHLHHLHLLGASEGRLKELEMLRQALGDLNDLAEVQQLVPSHAVPAAAARRLRKSRKRLMAQAHAAAEQLFHASPARFARRLGHAAEPRSRRPAGTLKASG